ncbi:hypothetical protein R1flu_021089 [Riccia fluitans]|uniref:V-type proton ATPase subunit S1/VOA1 transmembrane domain-containing protein n=1 Tax=Riccia fluitans TaxID=41844 RepID=A0ABD1ZPZ3_9MARC
MTDCLAEVADTNQSRIAMARFRSILLLCASLAYLMIGASASLSLVPAFIWSNVRNIEANGRSITYETLSSESLTKTIISELGAQEEVQPVDFMVTFVGNKLRSVEVPRGGFTASDLLPVIQSAFTSSKSSFAIPYVTPIKEKITFADALLSAGPESRQGEVLVAGSCAYRTSGAKVLGSLEQLKAYLTSRKSDEKTDLVIVCSDVKSESKLPLSEGEVMEGVLKTLDESKAGYVASYVTDLSGENVLSLTQRRQLGAKVRVSNETFCDELCQTKATILEGLFVGLTLLIILISGICCMAGITTPSRFEQAKDQ